MKYFKQYKEIGATPKEITKEEAIRTLEGYWNDDALDDIFNNDKMFRLYTPYADVWAMTNDGKIPVAGFYGIC